MRVDEECGVGMVVSVGRLSDLPARRFTALSERNSNIERVHMLLRRFVTKSHIYR